MNIELLEELDNDGLRTYANNVHVGIYEVIAELKRAEQGSYSPVLPAVRHSLNATANAMEVQFLIQRSFLARVAESNRRIVMVFAAGVLGGASLAVWLLEFAR